MSKLKDKLREHHIVNTYDLLVKFGVGGRDVACGFTGAGDARSCRCAATQVWRPKHNTDPRAAWYNYGRKTFVGARAESLPQAIAWATERYGITEWVSDPTDKNTKIPREVLDAALAFLKANPTPNSITQ